MYKQYEKLILKRAIEATATVAFLALAWPAAAQVGLGLSPMKVEIPAFAGKSYSGSLSLTNAGSASSRIRVEMVDYYVDGNGTPQFIAHVPAESPYSCSSWLTANPMEVDVAAAAKTPVRYTIHVPAQASDRSYSCALGFRTIPAAGDTNGTSMRTAVRLMTVFYATVGKPAVAGVIKDLKLEQVAGTVGPTWRAVVIMDNTGLMSYRPTGELSVVDASGNVLETDKVPSIPVLPMRQQRIPFALKGSFTPGPYTLKARIEVGGETQEASVAVTATALPTAVAKAQ